MNATRRLPLVALLAWFVAHAFLPAAGASPSAAAQDPPRTTARLASGVVNLGSLATVVVEVTGTDLARLLGVPEADGLTLVDATGPSVRQSTSLIGRTQLRSVSISWSLRFRPLRSGELVIPSVRLEVDGKEVATEELVLRVVEDLRGEELGYLELLGAPARVYEGEPFELELRFGWDEGVAARVNHANLILPWWDSLAGVLPIELAPEIGVRRIELALNSRGRVQADDLGSGRVKGRAFQVLRTRRAFVATRTGTLEFPASFLEFGRREYGFLRETPELYYVQIPAFSIEVRALPEAGRPLDFSGGVGRLEVVASADRRDVDVGESIKLTVEWSGTGNLEFFQAPDLGRLDAFRGFRLYGSTDRFRGGRRTIVYDLAPETASVKEIPAVPLAIFDSARERYTTLESRPIPIRVRPLSGASASEGFEDLEPESDLRDLDLAPRRSGEPVAPGEGWLVGALVGLPFAWLGLRRAVRRRGDPAAPAARRRRAARRQLARELARAADANAQAAAWTRFLAARSGESEAAWEGRDVFAWREERAVPVPDDLARSLAEVQERLAARRWAGDGAPLDARTLGELADRLVKGGLP